MLANKIKGANPEHNEWPSDKYGLDNQTLPFYSLNYQQYLHSLQKNNIASSFVFYPHTKNTISSYTFFVQKLFNVFVGHLSVMDGYSLTLLMSELLHRGMKHSQQNKTNDALALYLMAQVVYCSMGADISFASKCLY